MFGILSAIFTGFGFTGLVYTIILQHQELAQARSESDDQRKTGKQQRFENTFFQLLTLFTDIVNSLRIDVSPGYGTEKYIYGRDALVHLAKELLNVLREGSYETWQIGDKPGITRIDERNAFLAEFYREWYERRAYMVAHYFRVLYRLLRHIDDAEEKDKVQYIKIVRAQLSEQELILLFYNKFIEEGEKMGPKVEQYTLFKHLKPTSLDRPDDLQKLYAPEARIDRPEWSR